MWEVFVNTYLALAALALVIWFFANILALWTVWQIERSGRQIMEKINQRKKKK